MHLKKLLTRMLLVAALLGVGQRAWAVDVPTPVYFNNFTSSAGLTIQGTGSFVVDDNPRFGKVFSNAASNSPRTNYLQLPSSVFSAFSSDGGKTAMTISFWVNAKNAGGASAYTYAPLFSAYSAAPTDVVENEEVKGTQNTLPMICLQSRGLIQINNAGWCDFGPALNKDGKNSIYNTNAWEVDGKHTTEYTSGGNWLDDNKWHLYTLTLTATQATVYLDGEVKNQWNLDNETNGQIISGMFTASATNLTYVCLGGNQAWNLGDNDAAFMFDDFAIYDAALSAEQIEKIIDTKLGYTKVTYDFASYSARTLANTGTRAFNANSVNHYYASNLSEVYNRFAFQFSGTVSIEATGLYVQRDRGDHIGVLDLTANDKLAINFSQGAIMVRGDITNWAGNTSAWTDYTTGTVIPISTAGNLSFQAKTLCKISSIVIKTQTVETMTVPTIISTSNGSARTVTITAGASNIKSGVTTFYTTDGSEPTSSSTVYSAPFDVTETTTIKAITISNSSAETASTVTTQLIDMDQVDTPTATLSAVDGIYRTITFACATEGATLYYSTDNGANYTQGTSHVISENTAITVKATKGNAEAVSDVYNFEAGTAITLNTPTWTKTAYSEGISTVKLTDDQSNKLLSPVSTIKYQINDGETQTYNTTIAVNDGQTLKYWSEATGYTNSTKGSVTAVAPCSLPNLWSETYNGVVNSDSQFTLGSEVISTVNTTNFYYVYYSETTKLSERLLSNNTPTSGDAKSMLRSKGIYAPSTMNMAILNLKVGDYVTINGTYGNAEFSVTGNTTDFTADEWNTTAGSKYCFTVKKAGTCRFSLNRQGYLQSITVQRALATSEATVGSTGYATFAADVDLDLSTLTEGFSAYFASSTTDGKVLMTKATNEKIAAGEGLFIQKTGDTSTFTITETREATTNVDNYLVAGDGVTNGIAKEDGYDKYVLALDDDGKSVSFFLINATPATVAKNKAYLKIPTGNGNARMAIVFDNEETGITNVEHSTFSTERVYNLNGQRITKPSKGLYIVNGKKTIVK